MNLSIAQLQMLIMAAPGLAVMLLAPSLIGVRAESLAHAMAPSAMVRSAESNSAASFEFRAARIASTQARASLAYISGRAPAAVAGSFLAAIGILASQFLTNVAPSRAP